MSTECKGVIGFGAGFYHAQTVSESVSDILQAVFRKSLAKMGEKET